MSRIVFLIEQMLDERNYRRFGIQEWLDRGWSVEVWNIMPLSAPHSWEAVSSADRRLRLFAGSHVIETRRQLSERLSTFDSIDYYIDFVGYSTWAMRVRRALRNSGAARVTGELGSIPVLEEAPAGGIGVVERVQRAVGLGMTKWVRRIESKLNLLYVERFLPADYVIVSGEHARRTAAARAPNARIIETHNFDYDAFLQLQARPPAVAARPYAVFLDQDIAFHPEYLFDNLKPYVTPERYFPAVCASLRALGASLGLELRVAAHPRASYARRDVDYFEGIPVEYHKTAELIRGASVVVCHTSTAIQYAVLFEKPLVFITTDELAVSSLGSYAEKFAEILGKHAINIDRSAAPVDWTQEARVDHAAYDAYRNDYIKIDGSDAKPLWQIVIDHLEHAVSQRGVALRTGSK